MKVKNILRLLLLILVFEPASNNLQAQFNQSYFKLTTSNGLIVSVFDTKTNRIDYVYPHIFALIDSGIYVHPFVGDIRLKSNKIPLSTGYLQNTHIISSQYKEFSVNYFASFTRDDKVFYIVIKGAKAIIENLEFEALTGEGKPIPGIDHLENPLEDLPCRLAGKCLRSQFLKLYEDGTCEKYFLFSLTDTLHTNDQILVETEKSLKESKSSLLDAELEFMRNVMASCKLPANLTNAERNAAEQSISILKMSQVSDNEIFPDSHGQILASLRPGLWHTAWVRDGSYAIQAMTHAGLTSEARKGLEFMLKAPSNYFKNYIYSDGKNYGPGIDYRISLTRYFGNGKEECDYNEYGPNIEYDDYGLFLTAFCDYVQFSNDKKFFDKWYKTVKEEVADVIIAITEQNGLIKADSGPWEHHLQEVKQYAFTSAVNARGLEMLAETEKKFGVLNSDYQIFANQIKEAIIKNLWIADKGYFKGNIEDSVITQHEYWDAGTFEIFGNGLVSDNEKFYSQLAAYAEHLRIIGDRDGYIRLKSADPYENQEWVFIDLRIAMAYLLQGNKTAAKKIIDYITKQAAQNFNTIPEMYSNANQMKLVDKGFYGAETWCNCIRFNDGSYIGTIPMVGYGTGAYLLALLQYYR